MTGPATGPVRVKVAGDLFHGRIPDGARYVGRSAPGLRRSRWANPHRVGKPCAMCAVEHDPAGAVRAYAAGLTPDDVDQARAELAGVDLACWCKEGQPCHVDVLLEVANAVGDAAGRVAAPRGSTRVVGVL